MVENDTDCRLYVGHVPNDVRYRCGKAVEFDGKQYGEFYISYNSHDAGIYGCDTTALVLGQMQYFVILNGDHADALADAAKHGGLDACMSYVDSHLESINVGFSDYRPETEPAGKPAEKKTASVPTPAHILIVEKIPAYTQSLKKHSLHKIRDVLREYGYDEDFVENIDDRFCQGFGAARDVIIGMLRKKYWDNENKTGGMK